MVGPKSRSESSIELHPDAWERFERAAGVVAKSPPQHRQAAKKKSKTKKKPPSGGLKRPKPDSG
jgi:hypothetical protein